MILRGLNVVKINNREDLKNWLLNKPSRWAVIIATRVALRAVPFLLHSFDSSELRAGQSSDVLLQVFRAIALPFAVGSYPETGKGLSYAANAAANAAFATANSVHAANAAVHAANAAAHAANAAVDAAIDAAVNASVCAADADAAAWKWLSDDLELLENDTKLNALIIRALWGDNEEVWPEQKWRELRQRLLALDSNWNVWVNWYEDRLVGRNTAGLSNDLAQELDLKIARQDNKWWTRAPGTVNASIERWTVDAKKKVPQIVAEDQSGVRFSDTDFTQDQASKLKADTEYLRTELSKVASPDVSINSASQLDAVPNKVLDRPISSGDLATLPQQQREVIRVIVASLPGNTPPVFGHALNGYSQHLLERGAQPIVGLLQQLGGAIERELASPDRVVWDPGLDEMFGSFLVNHASLLSHFPLLEEREELFSETPINEAEATGTTLVDPIEGVAVAAEAATDSKLTTKDFLQIVQALHLFAKDLSTVPADESAAKKHPEEITVRRRFLLNSIGFFERSYNLIGTTASIATSPQGIVLSAALYDAVQCLLTLIV